MWVAPWHEPKSQTEPKGGRELNTSIHLSQPTGASEWLRARIDPSLLQLLCQYVTTVTRKVTDTLSMFKAGWAKPCSVRWWLWISLGHRPMPRHVCRTVLYSRGCTALTWPWLCPPHSADLLKHAQTRSFLPSELNEGSWHMSQLPRHFLGDPEHVYFRI